MKGWIGTAFVACLLVLAGPASAERSGGRAASDEANGRYVVGRRCQRVARVPSPYHHYGDQPGLPAPITTHLYYYRPYPYSSLSAPFMFGFRVRTILVVSDESLRPASSRERPMEGARRV